jgi:hypothetical protein
LLSSRSRAEARSPFRCLAIPLFLDNTAAFIHELPLDVISNAAGDSNYVRVQVLSPINVLERDKQPLSSWPEYVPSSW